MANKVNHDKCCPGNSGKCSSSFFKRMNYFHGMLLTEQDFVDEQNYFREKLKLHNRLYGTGVVWGLALKKGCVKLDSKEVTKIFIEAGLALDCAGNEIIVCEDYLIPLDEKINKLRQLGLLKKVEENKPLQDPPLYIGIRYCECKSQPVEQYTSECADDRLRPQFSRVREGFSVELFTLEELPGCLKHQATGGDCSSSLCPDCDGLHRCGEEEQIIILGCIDKYDTGNADLDHKNAVLTPSENCLLSPVYSSQNTASYRCWEAQRQRTLVTVFKKAKWIDISVLIGEGPTNIKERLEKMDLKLGEQYTTESIPDLQMFLENAKCAQPWVASKSTINIVMDPNKTCIQFLFVKPPA